MPGCEQFLADEKTPGGVLLVLALPPHLLLALRHCIQHMLPIAAQRPHLETKDQQGLSECGRLQSLVLEFSTG